jgi:methyl-accepting chemotaxis protein
MESCKMKVKKSIFDYGLKRGIARKLIVYLLAFSSLVTLILTSIQLYIEYTRDIQQIENRLELIEKSHLAAIETGLWSFDETLLKVQLKGILQMPDIQYIEIRPNAGKSLSAGILKKSNIKRKEFNLSFLRKEKENSVGILLVDVNMGGVYKRLINRAVIILLSQLIKTFLVSSFIFFIFYQLVGKHIISMASFFESIHSESMDQPLQLDRKPKTNKSDELDQLVTSFNRMRAALSRYYYREK